MNVLGFTAFNESGKCVKIGVEESTILRDDQMMSKPMVLGFRDVFWSVPKAPEGPSVSGCWEKP
jgi:hypothetical protein